MQQRYYQQAQMQQQPTFPKQQQKRQQQMGVQIPKTANCSYAGIAKVNIESQSVPARLGQNIILLDNSSGDEEIENVSPHSTKGKSAGSLKKSSAVSQFFDKRVVLYKTEMCRAFTETGICKYGFQCQFAHYCDELRPVLRHPRFKTDVCKTWWKSGGKCPYGKRCCFIHDENAEELARLRGLNMMMGGGSAGLTGVMVKKVAFSLDDMHIPQQQLFEDELEGVEDTEEAWCHLPQELQEMLLL